jgi:non-specific serine/threonine protein kinase
MSDSANFFPHFYQSAADLFGNILPAQLTSLVGREREVSEIKQLLSLSRMLTLTGMGGVGKTRLALQIAHEFARDGESLFDGGIWFVTLAHLRDPAEILSTLARTLGLSEDPEQTLLAALHTFLSSKKALLLLDNCEHLIDACASLVESLLQMCPDLCILATSREVFGISGETVYSLLPLSVPSPSASLVPEDLTLFGATVLFLERARSIHPYFRATARNAATLVEICQRLDGLPLAIELAAARIRVMSAEQIAQQVSSGPGGRFSLLTSGSRTALPRQHSLRATMDWSYALLSPAEQRLLLRLAVFAGGWTLEAAQAVCSGTWTEDLSILDGLARLVDKSLVLADKQPVVQTLSTGETLLVDQARYTLLATVREYALEKLLETGEEQEFQRKYLEYFLSLAEKAEPELRGASQLSWLTYLDTEHENFRAALEYSRTQRFHEAGLRLANALWWYWAMRASFSEGRTWLAERALSEEKAAPALRATALYRAGMLAFFQGDLERVDVLAEESLALFRALKDTQGIAVSLSNLVHVSLRQRNHERAQHLGEESVALARTVGDRWYLAFVLLPLAVLRIRQGQYTLAAALIEESLRLFHTLGDRRGMAYAFDTLGQLADGQRDNNSSVACYEQSFKLFEQLNDRVGIASALLHLGFSFLKQGKYAQASPILKESLKLCQGAGRRIGIARALLGLARIKLHLLDYQEATLLLEESLYLFREHGDVRGFAETLNSLRDVALQQGQFRQVGLLLQHNLGGRYQIDETLDMVASLETIASSEIAQTALAGRMRPAGWLRRVIGTLHEKECVPESEQKASVSWAKNILEEHVFILAPVYPFVKETARTLLPWNASTSGIPLSLGKGVSIVIPPTQKQLSPPLTEREQEVLQLVEHGLSNGQIAQRLVISVGTVRTHLASIYNKLGVTSRTAAVHSAHERHIL